MGKNLNPETSAFSPKNSLVGNEIMLDNWGLQFPPQGAMTQISKYRCYLYKPHREAICSLHIFNKISSKSLPGILL